MKINYKISAALIAVGFATTAYALSTSDNLGAWRSASYSDQAALCRIMASRLQKPGLTSSGLCSCISETAGDGALDFMTISETAAACSVLSQ